ncbi:MAG: hypothetical protein LBE18_11890 [Planctomycetaceae bacterium]|jgi:hypothetical protein|nr:hypothetical protein [Planctomycetaceae bacterium]
MRTKTKLLLKTIVLVVLAISTINTIGCKSKGGPWYDVRSYKFYNPLRPEDHASYDNAPSSVANNQIVKPHIDQGVEIKQPEGGYYEQRKDNNVFASTPTNGLTGTGVESGYPIQKTVYHSEQVNVPPTTPNPYSDPSLQYNNGLSNNPVSPITTTGYNQPPNNNLPTGYNYNSEVKNDANSLNHGYTGSNNQQGNPSGQIYSAGNYSAEQVTYPQPTPQVSGNVNNNGTITGPFATPPGQPTTVNPSIYGNNQNQPNNPPAQPNLQNYGNGTINSASGSNYNNMTSPAF